MRHSIRGRLILIFIGLAVGPLLVTGIILAWQSSTAMQQQALTGVSAPAVNLVIVTLILAVLMGGIAGALSFLFARRIIEPIQALTEAVGAIGAGDLAVRPQIPSDDEIGILAGTFNSMARRLRDRICTLERQDAEHTKVLDTFHKVIHLSAILDEKQLAAAVVEQVKNTFNYYHVQIFFYDGTGENLILAGGTGEIGQRLLADGYMIPRGKGPAGRAAESNTPVLVGDTSQDSNGMPNPLLAKTKSEVAVPIAVGDQVLGVLDVQQNILNGMTQADADLLQSIANQVAIAVRHADSTPQVRQQAEREALIASISRKIQETTTAEDALQVTVRELGHALGSKKMRVVLTASRSAGPVEAESRSGGDV
jgi:nitrate/nitrite-specific signal transduction histidine kinase